MRKPFRVWLIALAAVAFVAVVGGVSSAGADDYPKVILIEGASNKTCEELSSYGAPGASWLELKFDSGNLPSVGSSSTGANGYLSVTLTRTDTDTWSWTSTKGIDAVLVKSGASGHNLYVYDPPVEATSGSGLTVPGDNGTSHVSFCYDGEQAPPPPPPPPPSHETGTLKVVKVIENAPHSVGFGDFSHSVDGGAAVTFDADGVSEYTFNAGTSHDVTEPEANGEGYTTSYSDDCSDGVIVANQTITCTITNTFGDGHTPPPPPPPPPHTPPPPPPPPPPPGVTSDEFMDVQVIKDATPQVQLVNGQADIAYTIRIRNNGPNQAHNVQLVDAAPSGVTFLAITLQPVDGSCTVTPALLSCSLGTLGPGVERTIGVSARVTQTGTYVNSATGTGQGKDTNGANNTDDASTLVTAPALPPTVTPKPKPKPKPEPEPEVCRVLRVTPGMVKANGKHQVVLAKVTQRKNPRAGVAVTFSGAGITKVVRTDRSGVARFGVTPGKAGIVLVKITSAKACNSARIGVVGVFEPPVTG